MKKERKKIFSMFLCVVMSLSLLPDIHVYAVDETEPSAAEDSAVVENDVSTETSIESSLSETIVPDENGKYTVTNFAQLKELAGNTYSESIFVEYVGTEPFVFEESLTIPENLYFSCSSADMRIPAEVTVVTYGWIDTAQTLIVEGELITHFDTQAGQIEVSGTVKAYSFIFIYNNSIVGEENVAFLAENACFMMVMNVQTNEGLLQALQEAEENSEKQDREYTISYWDSSASGETIVIDNRLTIGSNTNLSMMNPFHITSSGQIVVDGYLAIFGPSLLNGRLDNYGQIVMGTLNRLGEPYQYGSLELGGTGTYCGSGEIIFGKKFYASAESALPGFDIADFRVTDYGTEWMLTLKQNDLEKLSPPTELEWGVQYGKVWDNENQAFVAQRIALPGSISWRVGETTQSNYIIKFYRVGVDVPVAEQTWIVPMDDLIDEYFSTTDFITKDFDSGEYYFTVTAVGDHIQYEDSDPAVSASWTYVKPLLVLSSCTKPVIAGREVSFLIQGDDTHVGGFELKIYFSQTGDEGSFVEQGGMFSLSGNNASAQDSNFFIYDDCIQRCGAGYYRVNVRALSSDITAACNGPWSEMSESVYLSSEDVQTVLTGILENAEGSSPDEIRAQVQQIDTEELKMAMLTDNDNSGVNASLQALELHTGGTQVEVKDSMAGNFNAEQISVIGASLNDILDAEQSVKLIVDQAKQNDVIPEMYESTIAVSFSMELENVDGAQLAVPVKVTLPVPAGLDPQTLVILHYHASGEAPEEIRPTVFQQNGQYYASFVLTSFCDFVMTVPAAEGRIPGDVNGDGEVNGMDLIRLRKYFAGDAAELDLSAADVTGDGEVNGMDLIRLRKYFAGDDVPLL